MVTHNVIAASKCFVLSEKPFIIVHTPQGEVSHNPCLVPVANTENTTVAEHAKLRAATCQQSGFNKVLQLEVDNKT